MIGSRPALVVWLTGLSGAGKTSVARSLIELLRDRGIPAHLLDADEIRRGLNSDLGYGPSARRENVRRVAHVAAILQSAGIATVVACTSPHQHEREFARSLVPDGCFHEVWVNTPLAVCQARDPKGLYRRARDGEFSTMVGLGIPYEAPEASEMTIDTTGRTPQESALQVLGNIESRFST